MTLPKRPARFAGFISPMFAVSTLCCGCAINNVGFVTGRVTQGEGARVVQIYGAGGVLRTWSWESGATIGFSKISMIYPPSGEQIGRSSWYWFRVPIPNGRPLSFSASMLGVALNASEREIGMTVGHRQTTVLALVPQDASVAMLVRYDLEDPEKTIVEIY